jgi:hypothetical protein
VREVVNRREHAVRDCIRIVTAAVVLLCMATGAQAGSGDAKPSSVKQAPAIQQTSHDVILPHEWDVGPPEPYIFPSKWHGPWEPTEIFGRDARCAPTPYAPRGYGFPKKLSPYRMDYEPYHVRDCFMESVHGPALWWRRHRDPCCDPIFGGCRKCDLAVDNQ